MLPANHQAGFGDLSFNSLSHPISHFNSAPIPFSYPNQTKFQFELPDPNGAEEEDEWAVYASSRGQIGDGDLQAGPTTQKPEDSIDEWGMFVASPVADAANLTVSPDISSTKVQNGGLQVNPSRNGEDWGLFSSYTGNTTEPTPTIKSSPYKDNLSNLQANPSPVQTLVQEEQEEEEEEEEEWGTFVSTPIAPLENTNESNPTRISTSNGISQRKLGSINLHVRPTDYEEEWGEFVSSPVAASTKSDINNSSNASPTVKWEKPKGPIPLSFFGGEEEESVREEIKPQTLPNLRPVSHSLSSPDVSPSNSSEVSKEIAFSPYGGSENSELNKAPSPKINGHDFNQDATTTNSLNGFKSSTSNSESTVEKTEYNASRWDPFVDGENGVSKEVWEFKNASSDMTSGLTASPLEEDLTNSWDPFSPLNEQAVSSPASELKDGISGRHIKADYSEKQMISGGLVSSSKMTVHETDQSYSSESAKDAVLKFYRKLQEGSLLLISHHVKGHKEAPKINTFVGQNIEEERHEEEIQQACRVLKNFSEALNFEGCSRDECINGLLNSTEEVYLKVFEREYQLSTKILLAVENLGAALDLLNHSIFTVNALEMTSMEGINSYISTWYSLISVCSQELKNGASIWAQSFNANLSEKLILSGEKYFIALGEIYRIVEILRLTLKRCRSLLLLSNQNRLNGLDMCLDICTKEWSSGLNVALETISDGNSASALNVKSLAESIKRIRKVDIQNNDLYKEKTVCRLCLLPLGFLSEMKSITWHGDRYLIKLVNLWANKISDMPPRLPLVK